MSRKLDRRWGNRWWYRYDLARNKTGHGSIGSECRSNNKHLENSGRETLFEVQNSKGFYFQMEFLEFNGGPGFDFEVGDFMRWVVLIRCAFRCVKDKKSECLIKSCTWKTILITLCSWQYLGPSFIFGWTCAVRCFGKRSKRK